MRVLRSRSVFEQTPGLLVEMPLVEKPLVVVANRSAFREFLEFPRGLYRHDPLWAPPFDIETESFFDAHNPYWKHAETQLFLYREGGRVLGRVAVIADHHFVHESGEAVGYFGYFESVNDIAIAGALLEAARTWLAARGLKRMRGPINGRLENGCGFLYDGFEHPPFMMMPYNPPYYIDLMEAIGFGKCRDLVAYLVDLTTPIPSEVTATAERCAREGFRVRPLDTRRWNEERLWLPALLTLAFAEHWGNVAPPPEDRDYGIDQLRWLIDASLCLVAEYEGHPVGLRWMSGDYSPIYRRLRGRLGLSGLVTFAWCRREIRRGKSVLMGIEKELRGRGLGTCLNFHAVREMQRRGYTELEYSWIDEHNQASRRAAEKLGGRLQKRYRIFETEGRNDGSSDEHETSA